MIRNASCHDAILSKNVRGILAAAERFQLVSSVCSKDCCGRRSSEELLQSGNGQVGFVCVMNGGDVEPELVRQLSQIIVIYGLVGVRVAVEYFIRPWNVTWRMSLTR